MTEVIQCFRDGSDFSKDVGMKFGIEKWTMLVIEKRKIVKSVGIELPDGKVIQSLQKSDSN